MESEPTRYETCQIELEVKGFFLRAQSRFWADAIGARGTYNAGTSSWVRGALNDAWRDKTTDSIHRELINKLVQDGWEPTGSTGSHYWQTRFRRPVK